MLLRYSEEEVVRLFLRKGYQISKTVLPLVLSNPERIISKLDKLKPHPFIITKNHIEKISEELKKQKTTIETLKEYTLSKNPIRIEDYVKHLHTHYEKIKKILFKRMDKEKLISINKISKSKTFSIIGIVREKRDNNLLLEDPSGETRIFFDKLVKKKLEDVFLDDVIGIRCRKIKDNIFAKNIIYPDILSSREIRKTDDEMKLAVISNPSSLDYEKYQKLLNTISKVENLSTIFLFNNTINEKLSKDFSNLNSINISRSSNPTLFQIKNVKILTLPRHFFEKLLGKMTPINFMISIMKRRSLFTIFNPEIYSGEDGFILEKIPDILISNLDESGYKNYKGTTVISNSDPDKMFLVNLKTREVKETTITI